jgi:hypothetical protein
MPPTSRTIVMFDTVDVSTVPADAIAVAGYTSGSWPTFDGLVRRFPHAHHLSIAVQADHDADCLDVETGDASPDQAPAWVRRQLNRGVWRPCLYANLSTMPAVIGALAGAGLVRPHVRLWVAEYNYHPHIPAGFDACQWTDQALGRNLDESLCWDSFFIEPDPYAVLMPRERQYVVEIDHLRLHEHLHHARIVAVKAELVRLRKAIWVAAVRGKLPDGTPTQAGWNVHNRAARYRILAHKTE